MIIHVCLKIISRFENYLLILRLKIIPNRHGELADQKEEQRQGTNDLGFLSYLHKLKINKSWQQLHWVESPQTRLEIYLK